MLRATDSCRAHTLRGGALLASLLGTMPLWKVYHPLPVLALARKKKKEQPEEEGAAQPESQDVDVLFD
jgi:hypothetical protein